MKIIGHAIEILDWQQKNQILHSVLGLWHGLPLRFFLILYILALDIGSPVRQRTKIQHLGTNPILCCLRGFKGLFSTDIIFVDLSSYDSHNIELCKLQHWSKSCLEMTSQACSQMVPLSQTMRGWAQECVSLWDRSRANPSGDVPGKESQEFIQNFQYHFAPYERAGKGKDLTIWPVTMSNQFTLIFSAAYDCNQFF